LRSKVVCTALHCLYLEGKQLPASDYWYSYIENRVDNLIESASSPHPLSNQQSASKLLKDQPHHKAELEDHHRQSY
jgi:hypothetical protein